MMLSKLPKKFSKYLGYFWNKISRQEISKIAQSGHTTTNKNYFKRKTLGSLFHKTDNKK